jgi:hypothetical protein
MVAGAADLRLAIQRAIADPSRPVMQRSQLGQAERHLLDCLSWIIEARNGETGGRTP